MQGETHGLRWVTSRRWTPLVAVVLLLGALALPAVVEAHTVGPRARAGATPTALILQAAIIAFREGLEAVLILASLLGGLRAGAERRLRAPLWWGALASCIATVATWLVAQRLLVALSWWGDRLAAAVSLLAVGVLLLITNWFFHGAYWARWLARFHRSRARLAGGATGAWAGLALLGFASIYREGFETVLFAQALTFGAGARPVLLGLGLGALGTLLVGALVLRLGARLPHKRLLVATGVLIGVVLVTLVGDTAATLQGVGWLPTHRLVGLALPTWAGLWLGLFPTAEGLLLQLAATTFVVGSYLLATGLRRREFARPVARPALRVRIARLGWRMRTLATRLPGRLAQGVVKPLHVAVIVSMLLALPGNALLPLGQTGVRHAAAAGEISYQYDALGRLAAVIDPSGDTARYEYDAVGNLLSISRSGGTSVAITGFNPTSGPVGTTVTIQGTGFDATPAQNTFKFATNQAATVTSASPTELVVTVPAGATTGAISVTAPNGTATGAGSFTVVSTAAPLISAISPTIVATDGTFAISGTNFSATPGDNTVTFLGNGTTGKVLSSDAHTLTVRAPSGGVTGKVRVTTATGTADSAADVFVVARPYFAADVESATRLSLGQSQAYTITTAGKIVLVAFEGTVGQRLSVNPTAPLFANSHTRLRAPNYAVISDQWTDKFTEPVTLPTTGTYTLEIDPDGARTGSATLTVHDIVDLIGTIAIDDPAVTTAIATPGQRALLTFSATAGQVVRVVPSSPLFTNTRTRIRKPDNTVLAENWTDLQLGPVTLPVTGTYTLEIDPNGALTGSANLRLASGSGSVPAIVAAARRAPLAGVGQLALTAAPPLALSSALIVGATNSIAAAPSPAPAPQVAPSPQPQPDDDDDNDQERWKPNDGQKGNAPQQRGGPPPSPEPWRTNQPAHPNERQAPLEAKEGVTALAGQVLALTGRPLAGVTLRIDKQTARTDGQGRFLLQPLTPGHHELVIDGRSANQGQRQYGVFVSGINLVPGKTTILPHTIWLLPLDTKHTVKFDAPTKREVVLTTPTIPGLEVRIPAGTTLKDQDGHVVTELGITAIPLDKSPFPLPTEQTEPPVFFTVQAGGGGAIAALSQGARVIYPNYTRLDPGTVVDFWQYEPDGHGWEVYGKGAVSADGTQVVPDPGVAVTDFYGAMFGTGLAGILYWLYHNRPQGGDPVDLKTGIMVLSETDLMLGDTIPLALERVYRPKDTASRPFGVGATHLFEMFISSAQQYQQADLNLPDCGRVHYVRISAGTGWTDAVFEAQNTPTQFYKSRITWNGNGWDLTLKDGTVFVQGENAPMQGWRDRNGNQVTITRTDGPRGNIVQLTTSNGRWIAFRYDGSNRIIQATDNAGRVVGYTYDGTGRLSQVTRPDGSTHQFTYTAGGSLATIKDARNITFLTNEYDANGRVSKQTFADGSFTTFAYTLDGGGNVTETLVTDPRGTQRRVTFGTGGYPLTDTIGYGTASAQTATTVRDATSNLPLSITDPTGRKTTFTYDTAGNVLTVTRLADTPQAVTVTLTYQAAFNRLASVTDPLGHQTTYDYDARGNLVAVHAPLGRTTTITYNAAGQPLMVTDPLGHTATFTYSHGDLVATSDPLGHGMSYLTDGAGRLLSVTDPLGAVTRYAYDVLNRLTGVTNPLGGVTGFAYDANNNRTGVTDPLGHTTTYAYDTMDRPTGRTDPLAHTEGYTYGPGGLLATVTDRKGQATGTTYDVLGRPTTVTFQGGATLTYTYDGANRVTQVVDSANGTISWAYDDLDRVTQETSAQGTVLYAYNQAGGLTTLTVVGQAAITYGYDAAGRPTTVTQGAATTTVAYDAADRRTGTTFPSGIAASYSYDNADRLTSIAYTRGVIALGDLTYGYDNANRVTTVGGSLARVALPPATTATAAYNAANQLIGWNGATLTYDLNGNLTGDGANTYSWNARDQLTAIAGGSTASFAYDALGRRAAKTLGGTTTSLLLSAGSVVQELQGGTPVANRVPGLGTDETLTRTDGAGTRTPLTDGLGSVLALVDDSGAVQTEYTYGPFGATTTSGAASTNASQYTGRDNDGTGLYYYRARYYSPTLQRFISEDPLGFGGGDANLYAYVRNTPTNLTDPNGTCPEIPQLCAIGAGAALGAAGGYWGVASEYLGGRKDITWGEVLERTLKGAAEGAAMAMVGEGIGAALDGVLGLALADDVARGGARALEDCVNSFTANTPVTLADGGSKPIGEVQVGDQVLAYDEASGQTGPQRVTAVIVHDDPGVVALTLGGERLTTTVAHPLYTRERGWVEAGQLHAGDHVRTESGWWGTVQGLALHPTPRRLYNLTVEGAHTFFVGAGQWLVHNASNCINTGNIFHYNGRNGGSGAYGPSQLEARYPNTLFKHSRRGQRGADAEVIGGQHPATYPGSTWPSGSNYGDFKPDTPRGHREFRRERRNGKLPPDTTMLPYDPSTLTLK